LKQGKIVELQVKNLLSGMGRLWNVVEKECEEPTVGVYIVVARSGGATAPTLRDDAGSGNICPRE
jgi:hypothetical protein